MRDRDRERLVFHRLYSHNHVYQSIVEIIYSSNIDKSLLATLKCASITKHGSLRIRDLKPIYDVLFMCI